MSELIGITQAAKILGVDRTTVFRWIIAETLRPKLYIGKRAIFDATDIRALAARRAGELSPRNDRAAA
jgi:predicted site-specific integrase-resolvase